MEVMRGGGLLLLRHGSYGGRFGCEVATYLCQQAAVHRGKQETQSDFPPLAAGCWLLAALTCCVTVP